MADEEDVKRLLGGVQKWNAWREQHLVVYPNLSGADLSGADLHNADLNETTLRGAYLGRADLYGANLSGADLSGADLFEANLGFAYLGRAGLYGANLSGADLGGAVLSGADLHKADLRGAILGPTILAQIDLRSTKGLVEIRHEGPSYVELHSIQLPQDGSALHFLRGAGVPDEWIDFYRSTMMHPIQYHSCFISFSHHDEALARRLHSDLQAQGVRCWFAPEDMKIGNKIRSSIDEAIHIHEKLLLILSEHALASDWVEKEVETALEKEARQKRLVLFPVRVDESIMNASEAWAADIRRMRHIGDFTRWEQHQEYQKAFTRLLGDLKKAEEG